MNSKDIKKTEVNRTYNKKRKKNRRSKMPRFIYGIIILVLVFVLLYTLSATVMFNIKTFNVTGNVDNYSAEKIIEKSGIKKNDNMFVLDSSKYERKIVESFPYIETAKIIKHFPDTLEIKVTKCAETYNIAYDGGVLSVSKNGKIIETKEQSQGNVIQINGFDPVSTKDGDTLRSKDSQKDKIFQALKKAIRSDLKYKIDSIDITDKYNIIIQIDSRIIFKAGSWSDIDYKIELAESAVAKLDDGSKGYLTMVGSNQVSFRTAQLVADTKKKAQERLAEQEASENASETTSENTGNN